jgi:hypothetical protein
MSPFIDRSSRQLISVCAIKMAFSSVSFSAISAMLSTEGKGSYLLGLRSLSSDVETVQGEFYMCVNVSLGIFR